ncbi:MAG: type VI secretion system protein TssA [Acidobacteria bacterium]|nr:type VI secretion system protein TssA [Acidobacteriota bacterium]
MASPDIVDFDRLLQPISAEQPSGKNLRGDISPNSLYYAIKSTRNAARDTERKVPNKDEKGGGKVEDDDFFFRQSLPDWRRVDEQARILLAEHSKDLEITAWFIEALVRLYGFAGLRDGFRLARELIVRFWDDVYPLPDEDGVISRVAPLAGLNGEEREGTLIMPIRRVSLTESIESSIAPPITYLDYQRYEQQQDSAARAQSRAILDRITAATSPGFFSNLRQDLEQCQEQFASLCQILDEKCGSDVFPSRYIRGALANCREALRDLSKESDQEEENQAPLTQTGTPGLGPTNLTSRENALQILLQVAGYFERSEPHSPISYLLKQVVRWGRMSLPELLSELIADEKARSEYCKLTGIRKDSQ